MAKKKNDLDTVEEKGAPNPDRVLRTLRDRFNKDKGELDRVAWIPATDEDNPTDTREFISTGSTLLDYCISNRRDGGIPVGKITEISGEEGSGKSLLAAQIIANVQKKGGYAVLIDTENAYNPEFAARLGVDNAKLLYLQPGTIENCFESLEQCVISIREKDPNALFAIVWDSVAATPPQAEIEGDYDPNSRIGLMAKAMAKGMRKLTNTLGKERVALVFTNQLKMRPGVMYGDPWVTPGGKAIPYHASVRIRLTSSTKLKDKNNQVFAIKTTGKAVKTRLGPPHRSCVFNIQFATGVDDVGSWRDFLHDQKLIEKRAGYMIMKNVPGEDGKVIEELKFREADWLDLIDERPALRSHILDLLEERMTVRYSTARPTVVDDDVVEIPDGDGEHFEGDLD